MQHDVLTAQKQAVPHEFDRVARRYDLLTGCNPGYKKHLRWSAERMQLAQSPDTQILDLCCGTGLSTEPLVKTYPRAKIVGLDASAGMLAVAAKKPWAREVRFVCGDAMDPAASGAPGPFDGILMAYGIRNVPDKDRCLANLLPLLRPGAPLCLHEYSVADSAVAKALWNAVALSVIMPLGIAATRNVRMWSYLRDSVNRFDGVHAMEERLRRHGYVDVQTLPMNGWQRGIVHSFVARRPRA